MRRQFAKKALIASSAGQIGGVANGRAPFHHRGGDGSNSNTAGRSSGGGGNYSGRSTQSSAASAFSVSAAPALSPAASVAYRSTVPFARDKLFTANYRTTEYYVTNERQILLQLRAALGAAVAALGGGHAAAASSIPYWLLTRVEVALGGSSEAEAAAAEDLSAAVYKALGVSTTGGGAAATTTSDLSAAASAGPSDLTGTLRNLLALRSHHGLVLTDQVLVLAALAMCAPALAQHPEALVAPPPSANNGSAVGGQRLHSVAELGGTLPAAAVGPMVSAGGAVSAAAAVPPALLEVLAVIADDQRLPLHPLLTLALTAVIRRLDASTSVGLLRYGGGLGVGGVGPAAAERMDRNGLLVSSDAPSSSEAMATTTTATSSSDAHLSHAARQMIAEQLRPLLAHLTNLHALVNNASSSSYSNAALVRTYYGDASADSIAAQWFGNASDAASSSSTAATPADAAAALASIDLLALYDAVAKDGTTGDSQPFRRRGGADGGAPPQRQLSALERSMMGAAASAESKTSNNSDANSSDAASAIDGMRALGGSTTASSSSSSPNASVRGTAVASNKVLHLRLLAALAELGAAVACREALDAVARTLIAAHSDVFATALDSSTNTSDSISGDGNIAKRAEREALAAADGILQHLGYGYFMCDYVGSGAVGGGGPLASFASAVAVAAPPQCALLGALAALAAGQPPSTPQGAEAQQFLKAFPAAAGYWAACCLVSAPSSLGAYAADSAALASVGISGGSESSANGEAVLEAYTASLTASASADPSAASPLAAAVQQELASILAYARAGAATRAYCASQLFPAHNGVAALWPQIVEGEGDAAVAALAEAAVAEREQLADGLLGYVPAAAAVEGNEEDGAAAAVDGFLLSEIVRPATARIQEALALADSSSSSADGYGADSIALDAVVSTQLRAIVEAIDATLVADPSGFGEDGSQTVNFGFGAAAGRTPADAAACRLVAFAVERYEHLGSRLFAEDPSYESATYESLSAARGDEEAAALYAYARPATVFSAREVRCWAHFCTAVVDEVIAPLYASSSAPADSPAGDSAASTSDASHLQPRTLDLLAALQLRLLRISAAMAAAEAEQIASAAAMGAAVGDSVDAKRTIIGDMAAALAPLSAFAAAVAIPSTRDAVLRIVSGAALDIPPTDGAALVGSVAQLAVAADVLAASIRSLEAFSTSSSCTVAPFNVASGVARPTPLVSSVVRPMVLELFADYLQAHTAEMGDALKAAASHSSSTRTGSDASSTEQTISVGGRSRAPASSAASVALSPAASVMAAIPAAEAFQPLSSFTSLFEAARAAEDTELCLALRALRPSLFN